MLNNEAIFKNASKMLILFKFNFKKKTLITHE